MICMAARKRYQWMQPELPATLLTASAQAERDLELEGLRHGAVEVQRDGLLGDLVRRARRSPTPVLTMLMAA